MRASLPAISVCLLLAVLPGRFDAALADTPSTTTTPATNTPAAPASHPAAPGTPNDGTGTSADDAAAKHAKRTACLKSAKEKKLVGAQKSAFVKDCVGTP